jgi:GR25 family glycosyltransferase involved in LPS biosynthesis
MKLKELRTRVISLKDSTRRISFNKRMSDRIEFTFFDAFSETEDFVEYFKNSDIYEHEGTYSLQAVICCAKSHFHLWKEVLERGEPILILEDDAIFMDKKAEEFFNSHLIKEEFEVLFLDGKLVEEEYAIRSPYEHHSGVAYVMTPAGAKKLIEKIESEGFGAALDWEIINMQKKGLKCLTFNRVVIVPDASEKSQLRKLQGRDDLPGLLKHLKLNGRGVEIGVGDGKFSQQLASEAEFLEFYSVDSWNRITNDSFYANGEKMVNEFSEKCYEWAKEKLEPLGVKIIRQDSVEAAKTFPDNFFDFIYIDADHTEEAVVADIEAWYPKLRKGGMMAGHDYMDAKMDWENGIYSLFGVKSAVDNFAEKNNLNLIIIEEKEWAPWHSWSVIKK